MEPAELGQRIRLAREAKGLSQEDFAILIKRDQRSVSEYENGKRRIYAHDLPTIAKALDVPLMYLFEETLTEKDMDHILLEVFHQLEHQPKQTLIDMARLLLDLLSQTETR